jgi:hypothetical protein
VLTESGPGRTETTPKTGFRTSVFFLPPRFGGSAGAADLPGDFIALHGCIDRSAFGVSEDAEDLSAEYASSEFEAADVFTAGDVAGDAGHEEVSESVVEDDFDGDA